MLWTKIVMALFVGLIAALQAFGDDGGGDE
jgi:hypothetical protein